MQGHVPDPPRERLGDASIDEDLVGAGEPDPGVTDRHTLAPPLVDLNLDRRKQWRRELTLVDDERWWEGRQKEARIGVCQVAARGVVQRDETPLGARRPSPE